MNSSFLRAIFVTALKDTASKHGLKTDVLTKDFRLYIKVCVVLGKSQTQTCADLHTANPLAAPPTNIVFWWLSHFPDGNSRVQDIKGKMKTKTRYKTEMILITSKPNQKSLSLPFSVDLNGTSIHLSSSVNLGVTLDQNISFQQHVSRTCQICYFELRRISSIRHYLSQDALKTLISVLSCPESINGIPYSLAVLSSSFTNFKKFRTMLQGSSVELLSYITYLPSFTGFLLNKELNTNCFTLPLNL